jgi:ankyrin repeat protein
MDGKFPWYNNKNALSEALLTFNLILFNSDTGNTPAHCAASGHMAAMNCLLNHASDMTIRNHHGDTPDSLSRKHGHTLANQKAGKVCIVVSTS